MRELVPRQVDKKPRVPEEKGSGALEVEIGVWNSQGGGKDKHLFPPSIFLSLSHIDLFFFKPKTPDYTTNNSV